MDPSILSISSHISNVRQNVFPLEQWTITTRKGIIMQSKCTCKNAQYQQQNQQTRRIDYDREPIEFCNICRYHRYLPQLHTMPDMLFNNNLLRLEHYTGVGIEFNPLDALKLVAETKDPLRVAVADGWQSARADCPFAKSIVKPFDWTFTTTYRGTLLSAIKKTPASKFINNRSQSFTSEKQHKQRDEESALLLGNNNSPAFGVVPSDPTLNKPAIQDCEEDRLSLKIEPTDERIDVNKLRVREEILFYDDVTLYEDELADHGTAQYSVKIRVMPSSLFILARFYLRVDGVLARINDTRIYHEKNKRYLLREYTNREARLSSLNLPVSTVINPNELMNHLPLIQSSYEKLSLP